MLLLTHAVTIFAYYNSGYKYLVFNTDQGLTVDNEDLDGLFMEVTSDGTTHLLSIDLAANLDKDGELLGVRWFRKIKPSAADHYEDWSSGETVSLRLVGPPYEKPVSLTAAPASGEVALTWTTPAGDGGYAVNGHRHRHREVADPPPEWGDWTTAEQHATTAAVSGLTEDAEYQFEVQVCHQLGCGPSSTVRATVGDNPATGAPAVGGTLLVGQTLTATTGDIADGNGLPNAVYEYQWLRGDADIYGAVADHYTLTIKDSGKTLKVRVSFTDAGGYDESLTSAATGTVEGHPQVSIAAGSSITEGAAAPFTLTRTGALSLRFPLTVTYGVIETGDVVAAADEGKGKTASFTANDASTSISVDTDDDSVDEDDSTVTVTLSAGPGYTWGTSPEAQTVVADNDNTPATGLPVINGTAQVGETLTVDTSGITDDDGLTNATYSYQWIADDADISSATDSTYILVADDVGKAVSVAVSFTDEAGHSETLTSTATATVAQPNAPATGSPTISGTAQVSETLTADTSRITDDDGLDNTTFTYQWVSNDGSSDSDIQDATSATYVLVDADAGKTVKVRLTFTDDAGHSETLTSAATAMVAAKPNNPATGAPVISGIAVQKRELTVSPGTIADGDGMDTAQITYQWMRVASDSAETQITSATSLMYTLRADDVGYRIKVRTHFTDDDGTAETLVSAATATVEPPPTVSVSVALGSDVLIEGDHVAFRLARTGKSRSSWRSRQTRPCRRRGICWTPPTKEAR